MENFFKKIKLNLTLSRIVMASIIVFFLFYFWGLIFQTKDTVKHVQEQKLQEIKDKNKIASALFANNLLVIPGNEFCS